MLWNFPPHLRKATEARHVSRVFLTGGLERPFCEDVKVKLGLPWRLQDAGDARVMGYLPRKTANREWNQPKREKRVTVKKVEQSWRSEACFDARPGDAEFGV